MNGRRRWKFKPSVKNIAILILCLAVNFAGKFFAMWLNLPLWLDTIGTSIAAVALGPLAGAIVGGCTNILLELIYSACLPYFVVSIMIGIVVGVVYPEDNELFQVLFTAFMVAIVAIILSTPLNMQLYDGYVGNVWADALFDMLSKEGTPKLLSSVSAQAFSDFPDKTITLLLLSLFIRIIGKKKELKEGEGND